MKMWILRISFDFAVDMILQWVCVFAYRDTYLVNISNIKILT